MKCAQCGANLKLTDEYCPYCGRKNTQSSQHVKEKKYYEKDSTDTREKVHTVYRSSSELRVRGIAILILAVLVIVLLFVTFYVDERTYYRKQEWAVSHEDEVSAQIRQYLDEDRYEAFYGYCDAYHLTGWTAGPFLKYRPQMEAVRIGMFIDQRANEYLTADSVYGQNSAMESISGLLPEFYNRDSLCYQSREVMDPDEVNADLNRIYEHMEEKLMVYFDLTEEQARSLSSMSEEEILLLLEETRDE